ELRAYDPTQPRTWYRLPVMRRADWVLFCLAVILSLSAAPIAWSQDADLGKFKNLEGKIDIAGGTAHIPLLIMHKFTIMSGFFLHVSY
ncbi:MAG: hypothetical protein WAU47_08475, partial [Desulfobaccales bacterium]